MKQSKLQFCHKGTKTLRTDFYFNLGALGSLWQKRITSKFLSLIRPAALSPAAAAYMKHSKLQIFHEGIKTLRTVVYFNLGALVSLWQKRITSKFLSLIRMAAI